MNKVTGGTGILPDGYFDNSKDGTHQIRLPMISERNIVKAQEMKCSMQRANSKSNRSR